MPLITWWPGQIEPGVSDALVCQIDFMASIASYLGIKNTGPDSENMIDALLGKSSSGRTDLVLEANRNVAYRSGNYLLIPPYEGLAVQPNVNIETGLDSEYQLYDIDSDRGQVNNLAGEMPEKLNELKMNSPPGLEKSKSTTETIFQKRNFFMTESTCA